MRMAVYFILFTALAVPLAKAATFNVTYNGSTFFPSSITAQIGDTVTFTNSTTQILDLVSDPHPTHTNCPYLNVGNIAASQSATVTISQTGACGYHNHQNPAHTGTILAASQSASTSLPTQTATTLMESGTATPVLILIAISGLTLLIGISLAKANYARPHP